MPKKKGNLAQCAMTRVGGPFSSVNAIVNQPVIQKSHTERNQSKPNVPNVHNVTNVPYGLNYLASVDHLLVKQQVDPIEVLTDFVTKNKYAIFNSFGQNVFYAEEDSGCCIRNIFGHWRPFRMKILDASGREILHLKRPLACSSCCFPCCLQSIEVSEPPGNIIGTIKQNWYICFPSFRILNHLGEKVFRIKGSFCTYSLCRNVDFKIVSLTGTEVGRISKHWSGLAREFFTDADFFGVNFPRGLDVRMKAVLLGATFLIDAMYFED